MSEQKGKRAQSPLAGQLSAREIMMKVLAHGQGELDRSGGGLFASGVSAGLDLGLSVLLMATLLTAFAGNLSPALIHLLEANFYAVGFIFVVLGRSELFTEHTTIAIFPLLAGKSRVRDVGRLWGIIYAANLIGALLVSLLLVLIGPRLGTIEPSAFVEIGARLTDHSWWVMLLSALLAGWLMGLMAWLVAASRETISELFLVWLVAASIGYARLHHCIVGSVEVLCAMFTSGQVGLLDYGRFLLWSTLGNALGGVVFVALLKFTHVKRPGPEPMPEEMADATTKPPR